jgi:hypothetical protein
MEGSWLLNNQFPFATVIKSAIFAPYFYIRESCFDEAFVELSLYIKNQK